MMDSIHLSREQILLFSPFLNFVVVYFALVRNPQGELWTTLLKCAPIVCLILCILLKGFILASNSKSSLCIVFGLIFSCGGDALLNIDLFPYGMALFGVAQFFYISAFGWTPLKLTIGVPLYLLGATYFAVVYRSLDSILVYGIPIYGVLLLTMCWRSLARAVHKKDFLNVFCGLGAVLFVVSDGLISVNMFLTHVPNSRIWIMITYYFAQFAIALSTTKECADTHQHHEPKD